MSSSDEDRPPPLPAPARDPLLDDPAFAELVGPPPPLPAEPVFAEPVEEPIESLPVASVIRPKAIPLPPKLPSKTLMPVPVHTEPPKPQWFMACSVIGCFGVLSIAAVAALIWIAITLLANLGDKLSDTQATNRKEAPLKAARGAIAPTKLANDIEVTLPGRVDAVARAGGGRFLLMRVPLKKEIHVFDANQGQIIFSIPAGEPGTLFAAGAEKIITYDPIREKITRYNLFTGEQETEGTLKVPNTTALAMGSDSSGPLYVASSDGGKLKVTQVDAGTLASIKPDKFDFEVDANAGMLARASDNGVVLGVSIKDGAAAIWYGGNAVKSKLLTTTRNSKPAWATPSADGQFFYTPLGVYGTDGKPFLGTVDRVYSFPPAHGTEWFLSLDEKDEKVTGNVRRHPAGVKSLAQGTDLDKTSLTTEFPANTLYKDKLTAADRIHYWPGAGLVAVLPYTPASEPAKMVLFKLLVAEK